jgi:hypothetical protein
MINKGLLFFQVFSVSPGAFRADILPVPAATKISDPSAKLVAFSAQQNGQDGNGQKKQVKKKMRTKIHRAEHASATARHPVEKIKEHQSHIAAKNKHQQGRAIQTSKPVFLSG